MVESDNFNKRTQKNLPLWHLTQSRCHSYIRLRRVLLLRSGILLSPSDICFASLGGEYNITATIGSNITVACNNITLTQSAYHFQFDMAFVPTNIVLVKKKGQRTYNFLCPYPVSSEYTALCQTPFVWEVLVIEGTVHLPFLASIAIARPCMVNSTRWFRGQFLRMISGVRCFCRYA